MMSGQTSTAAAAAAGPAVYLLVTLSLWPARRTASEHKPRVQEHHEAVFLFSDLEIEFAADVFQLFIKSNSTVYVS